jgi:hypothetical protein
MRYFDEMLRSDKRWAALAIGDRTIRFRSLVFRLVCAASGRMHNKFVDNHRSYPFKTFGLLTGSVTMDDIRGDRSCLYDPWTASLLSHFTGRLEAPELKMELYVVAMLASIDTAGIEARHASIGLLSASCTACELQATSSVRRRMPMVVVVGALGEHTFQNSPAEVESWPLLLL